MSTDLGRRAPQLPSLLAALAIAVLLGSAVALVERLLVENAYQQRRADVTAQAATVRARLEGEINSTLFLTRGLIVYVSIHGDISQREFDRQAAEFVRLSRHIRNIGLAPDNVLRLVFPLAGNEAAIGLKYMEAPAQREAVLRAMDNRDTVVAGPVKLVQGGEGVIARTPIFVRDTDPNTLSYWGMASIVINVSTVLADAGLAPHSGEILFALRGKDALGPQGAVFAGDPELWQQDPVRLSVALPGGGSWELAAVPAVGWRQPPGWLTWVRGLGGAVTLLVALLTFLALRGRERVQFMALHDRLTGLPNRWLFDEHFDKALARARREGSTLAVLVVDLNDFKPVNDRFGHKAGDAVLIRVARRMSAVLRQMDVLARVGGDEFVALLPDAGSPEDVHRVADKLAAAAAAPMDIDGRELRISASIGCALYPRDGDGEGALLREADAAMYRIKHARKTGNAGERATA